MRRFQFTRAVVALSAVVTCTANANAGPYVDAVMADNPAGYWRMESADATITNEVVGSPDGALKGTGNVFTLPGPISTESSNSAIRFDSTGGTGSTYRIPDPSGLLGSNGPEWSVEYWLNNTEGGNTHQNPVVKGDHNNGGGTFFNNRSDHGTLNMGVNSGAAGTAGFEVPPYGEWTHVVGTLQRDTPEVGQTTITLYQNGTPAELLALDATYFIDGIIPDVQNDDSTQLFSIGGLCCFPGGSEGTVNHYHGGIDEVAVYNHVLSAERVAEHFSAAGFVIPDPSVWLPDASGDWDNAGNWGRGAIPNDNTSTARFEGAITAPRSVYTETTVTAKTINFDSAFEYAVVGNGSVNLESDAGNAGVTVVQGNHQFQSAVNLLSSTNVDVAVGAQLAINNALNQNSNLLTKTGDGTLLINNQLNDDTGDVSVMGGTVGGTGSIGGSLNNPAGTVAPGKSPGILTVEGDFVQGAGGTLSIEIGGTEAGEQYDQLVVNGNATVDGTVAVELIGGFNPQEFAMFDVLDFTNFGGTPAFDFSMATLGDGLSWDVSQFSESGLLCAGSCGDIIDPPDGDFDASNLVGVADLNLVLFNWNGMGSALPSDWTHQRPGDTELVGITQLNLVLFNWNAMGATAAVPEPSAAVLCIFGMLLGLRAGRRVGSRRNAHGVLIVAAIPTLLLVGFGGSAHAGPYVDAVMADNPIGYWRLEGAPGDGNTAVDSSPADGSQDGTYIVTGSGTVETIPGPIVTETSDAVQFNSPDGGNGVRINVPDDFGVLGSINDWTVEYWLNRSADGHGHQNPVVKGDYDNPNGGGTFNNASPALNSLDMGINNGALGTVGSPLPFVGEWTHVVGVYEPNVQAFETQITIYQNGQQVAQGTIANLQGDNSTDLFSIGGLFGTTTFPDGVNFFNGALDEVTVYTTALSAERVLAHFNASGHEPTDFTGVWLNDASSSWNLDANWCDSGCLNFENTVPNSNTALARFEGTNSAPHTVFTEEPVTVKRIVFSNPNEHVIAGNHAITLEADSGDANINVLEGDHQFQTVVNLNSNTLVSTVGPTTVSFNNELNLGGNTLTKDGEGTLNINNGLVKGGGMIVVNGGTIVPGDAVGGSLVTNEGGTLAAAALSVAGNYTMNAGSTLEIEIGEHHDVVTVGGEARLAGTLEIALVDGFVPSLGETFDILQAGSLIADDLALGGGADGFSFSVVGNSLSLTYVPEPASWMLFSVAAFGLITSRRRV